MTTTRRFFSGDSLEQAIMQAARHHHLLPEQVAYQVVEKRHGFLKIRRGVVIDVDPESPGMGEEVETPAPVEVSSPAVEPEPVRERPRADPPESREVAPWHLAGEDDEPGEVEPEPEPEPEPETDDEGEVAPDRVLRQEGLLEEEGEIEEEAAYDDSPDEASVEDEESFELGEDLAEGAREAVEQLLEFVDVEGLEIDIREGEDRLEVELSGEGQDRLLEDRGTLLLAIEHLVPRLLRGILGRSAPCRVDCAEFHVERERRLEGQATEAAEEVKRRHRPKTLAPMSPEERRIVHMVLADDPDIGTESQGRGFFKRVTISPVRHRSRVYD